MMSCHDASLSGRDYDSGAASNRSSPNGCCMSRDDRHCLSLSVIEWATERVPLCTAGVELERFNPIA